VRLALAQFNALVGDLAGNVQKMRSIYEKAVESDVDLLVFPELCVCGYPPEDLLHKRHFLKDNRLAVEQLACDCPGKRIIVGFAEEHQGKTYNSAAVLEAGKIEAVYRKNMLPNYGVFDERRYFTPGGEAVVISIGAVRIALTICFDIWKIEWLGDFLGGSGRIDMILNISASPFHVGKIRAREQVLGRCAKQFGCVVSYCNLVGGQDELVFDGRSMICSASGEIVAQARAFDEDVLIADIEVATDGKTHVRAIQPGARQPSGLLDEVYQALVLGTRDYARKNGFERVLLGLSGGIDSSVVAAIAAAALGPENVVGVSMPSRFNSAETKSDAEKLAGNLGIEFHTIPIEPILERFDEALGAVAGWNSDGLAYENLQARIRGCMLMSLSNQFGSLVLTTGNKSETAVGYTTLYGDTAGGFGVIKDVPKTLVYRLAKHINETAGSQVIPAEVITRPPERHRFAARLRSAG